MTEMDPEQGDLFMKMINSLQEVSKALDEAKSPEELQKVVEKVGDWHSNDG